MHKGQKGTCPEVGRIFQPLKLKLKTEKAEGSIGMVQIVIFMPNLVKQLNLSIFPPPHSGFGKPAHGTW